MPESPRQWLVVAAAMLFLAGAIGYAVGTRTRDAPRPEAGSVDVGFLHDMISHHEQAIEMAMVEDSEGHEPGVRTFAREVLLYQSREVGLMERTLEQWGYSRAGRPEAAMAWMGTPHPVREMPGMASEAEMRLLRQASGREADGLFIRLMQDHHRGGVHMAAYAADRADDEFVRAIARRMARNQAIEINEMERTRIVAKLPADPPGYVPADLRGEAQHRGH